MMSSTETQDDGAHQAHRAPVARALPHLFLVLEGDRPTADGARFGLDGVGQVTLGRGPRRSARRLRSDGVVTLQIEIPGSSMSRNHARLFRSRDRWVLEDLGSKNGTFVDAERVERRALEGPTFFEAGHTIFAWAPAVETPEGLGDLDAEEQAPLPAGLLSLLPALEARGRAFEQVARSRVPLLLRGESGTGKELCARAAHRLSGRPGRLVAVSGGGLDPATLSRQLFGSDRGDEVGLLRAADGGTLFLDELADLAAPCQAALLRAIEQQEVTPEGSSRAIAVDLRVIAATQPSPGAAARIRPDLLARLAGYTHELTPLRERKVDLGLVAAHALRGSACGPLAPEAAWALLRHGWPGNGREVRQQIESARVLASGGAMTLAHFPALAAGAEAAGQADDGAPEPLREALVAALAAARGNVAEVARHFGKGPTQIHRWMKRYGIQPATFRGP